MSVELAATGERMIEDSYQRTLAGQVIYLMHVASYDFARDYCRGKRVLDLGCGSGYGAHRIAQVARSVDAVDVSAEAVAYAAERYPAANLRHAVVAPDAPLPYPDVQFDVLLSFQVLEHVRDDAAYLAEAARVLTPEGVLLLITPDRRHRLFPGQRPWNRWHLREYGAPGLRRLVQRAFKVERLLQMELEPPLDRVELDRYRLVRMASLPFTLPLLPDGLRQWGLGVLGALQARRRATVDRPPLAGVGPAAVQFVEHSRRSLNLLVVARPAARAPG